MKACQEKSAWIAAASRPHPEANCKEKTVGSAVPGLAQYQVAQLLVKAAARADEDDVQRLTLLVNAANDSVSANPKRSKPGQFEVQWVTGERRFDQRVDRTPNFALDLCAGLTE